MNRCRAAGRRTESRGSLRGQALAETLVAMIALIPLFFGLMFIGKVASVQSSTVAASRALAFECANRIDDCARRDQSLADEVRRRHFTAKDGEPLSPDAPAVQLPQAEQIQHWTDRDRDPLLNPATDVGIAIEADRFNEAEHIDEKFSAIGLGPAGRFAGRASEFIGPAKFGLELDAGLIKAEVQALVAKDAPTQFDHRMKSIALPVRARTAILIDTWGASGAVDTGDGRSVQDRVEKGRHLAPYSEHLAYQAELRLERDFFGLLNRIFTDLGHLKLEPYAPVNPGDTLNRQTLERLPDDIRESGTTGSGGNR